MKKVSKTNAAYIAGFWEGDGCISRCRISISQKFPQVLLNIQSKLEIGRISKHSTRNMYVYHLNRRNTKNFILLVYPYVFTKTKNLSLSLKQLKTRCPDKLKVWSEFEQKAYIAGFFDAEGCVSSRSTHKTPSYKTRISITQKNLKILHWIKKVIKGGRITKPSTQPSYHYSITKKEEVIRFVRFILPYSIVKKEQLILGLELADLIGIPGSNQFSFSNNQERIRIHKLLKTHKRVRPKREQIHMTTALLWAQRSLCKLPDRDIGCVVTTEDMRKVLSVGYNGNPTAMPNDSCRNIPGDCGCVHAEANAITTIDGTIPNKIMFVTMSPCEHCANLIAQSNITKVFYLKNYRNTKGLNRLKVCGITVIKMTYPI